MKDYSKIDKQIKKISILYNYKKGFCVSFLVTDDDDIRKYIESSILALDEKNRKYDFYESRKNNIIEYKNICKQEGNLVLVTGLSKYAEYLKENGTISNVGHFYMNMFNMPRDSFYLKNNVRMIMLLNQTEYNMFLSEYGDDFASYAMLKIDIDEEMKEKSHHCCDILNNDER